jgi:hypothetical protein
MILLSNIYDFIINHFDAEPLVNSISCDKNDEIGSNKQIIYPLVNIELIGKPDELGSNLLFYEFAISVLSDRDFDKKIKSTKLIGKDNLLDNQNDTEYILQKFIKKTYLSNNVNNIDLVSLGEVEIIIGGTTTVLDGFKRNMTFTIPNTIAIC